MNIKDPERISLPGLAGDVGLGTTFAFPFTTIEDVIVFDRHHIGVFNDNNFPFSIGRHVGSGKPDDNEFIVIRLDKP
jgi:glycerophosphoryl diester phosphodiesterase